ncbi:MAG: hypothetical protein LBG17_04725 [Bacteroidales bacterium]|jgi:hypothetical protein|nr:hypothetical protein [Bacteroidales bacterium]
METNTSGIWFNVGLDPTSVEQGKYKIISSFKEMAMVFEQQKGSISKVSEALGTMQGYMKNGSIIADETFKQISGIIGSAFEKIHTVITTNKNDVQELERAYNNLKPVMGQKVSLNDKSFDALPKIKAEIEARKNLIKAAEEEEAVLTRIANKYQGAKNQNANAVMSQNVRAELSASTKSRQDTLDYVERESASLDRLSNKFKVFVKDFNAGGDIAAGAISRMGKAIDGEFNKMTTVYDRNSSELARLEQAYKSLSAHISSTGGTKADGRNLMALDKEIIARRNLNKELNAHSERLATIMADYDRYKAKSEQATGSQVTFRTQLMKIKNEMIALENAGKKNTAEYAALADKAQKLKITIDGLNASLRNSTTMKGSFLQGMVSGFTGLSGAMTATTGALALFAGQNEDLQKVMLRVQALMSITMGLSQVQYTLNKNSAFMIGVVNKVKALFAKRTAAAAAAQTGEAAAANAGAVANKGLAASFRAVGHAIKSIPVFGWIAAAIAAIISVVGTFAVKAAKASKDTKAINKSMANNAVSTLAEFEKLSIGWSRIGNNINEQNKFVYKYKEAFDNLGISITNAAEAENLFTSGREAFINSVMVKAKAAAAMELAQEKWKKILKEEVSKYEKLHTIQGQDVRGYTGTTNYWLPKADMTDEEAAKGIESGTVRITSAWKDRQKKIGEVYKLLSLQADEETKSRQDLIDAGIQSASEAEAGSRKELEAEKAVLEQKLSLIKQGSKNYMDTLRQIDAIDEKLIAYMRNGSSEKLTAQKSILERQANRLKINSAEWNKIQKQIEKIDAQLKGNASGHGDQKKLDEIQRKITEERMESRLKEREAEIGIMEDGYKKELAVITLNYDKMIAKNEAYKKEAEKIAKDIAELQWSIANPRARKRGETYDRSAPVELTAEQKEIIESNIRQANNYRAAAETKLLRDLLNENRDYEKQRQKIREDADAAITLLRKNRPNDSADEIKEIERKAKESIRSINDNEIAALKNADGALHHLFGAFSDKGIKSVKKTISEIQKYIAAIENNDISLAPDGTTEKQFVKLKENSEVVYALYKRLYELQGKISDAQIPFYSNLSGGLKMLKASAEAAKKALSATGEEKEKLEADSRTYGKMGAGAIINFANEAADGFARAAEFVGKLADILKDDGLKEGAEAMSAVAQNFQAAAKGAASGGWIGAIVGGVMDIITQSIEAGAQAAALKKLVVAEHKEFIRQIKLANLSLKDADFENIFGVDHYRKVMQAVINAREAWEEYQNLIKYDYAKDQSNSINYNLASNKSYMKALSNQIEDNVKGLQALIIKTKDYTGWANFWGKQDKYAALGDVAPEIFENGEFNVEKAKLFLETNTQITDEQRKQIENAIEMKEKYEEAMQAIRDDLQDTFGNLGAGLSDAIVDAFRNGTDAMEAFRKSGEESLEKLGQKLVYSLFLAKGFDALSKKLEEITMGDGTDEEKRQAYIAALRNYFGGMQDTIDQSQQFMADYQREAREAGFNIYESDLEASKKGFAAMSQDSANELNGRFTAIQALTISINNNVLILTNNSNNILDQLMSIKRNTARLDAIENTTVLIQQGVANIQRNGLRII